MKQFIKIESFPGCIRYIILYSQYGNNSLENIKIEGITNLTLFTEKVDIDTE